MSKPVVLRPAPPAPQRDMTTMVVEITPAQAEEFLRGNASNRPVRRSWVKTLREIIERGEWVLTHQGIALTPTLQLLDGQHRLMAIVQAGITVKMNVTFDCDPAAYTVIDGGIKRTHSDQLRVPPMVAAVARNLFKLPSHTTSNIVSSQQVASVLRWAQPVIERVADAGGLKSQRTSAPIQTAIAIHVMAGRDDVLTRFRSFAQQDFDALAPLQKAFIRQINDGKARASRNQWDLSARAWRAFHPEYWDADRLQVPNVANAVADMSRVADAFSRRPTT
jgi:hypothetical protein